MHCQALYIVFFFLPCSSVVLVMALSVGWFTTWLQTGVVYLLAPAAVSDILVHVQSHANTHQPAAVFGAD